MQALEGRIQPHHRFILKELLNQIDTVDQTVARFDQEIETYCRPFAAVIERVDTIPGVARRTAEILVAEIGIDMSRFATAEHLASWAGMVLGNHESAGKRLSGKTRRGNRTLKRVLIQAAHTAGHTQTYLGAQYRRLAAKRGGKRAAVAVGHSILVIAYHLIVRGEVYQELGGNYFDTQNPKKTCHRLVQRLKKLGYQVTLQPQIQMSG